MAGPAGPPTTALLRPARTTTLVAKSPSNCKKAAQIAIGKKKGHLKEIGSNRKKT